MTDSNPVASATCVHSWMFVSAKWQCAQLWAAVIRATWGTLKADVIVWADATVGLFLVDAPEAFLQTGVDHFPGVRRRDPVCRASLHGHGPHADSLPVVETYRLQTLVVSIPSRMVDVEPRRPLCHTWGHTEGKTKRMEGQNGKKKKKSVRKKTIQLRI